MLKTISLIAGILLIQNILNAQPEYPETKKGSVADEYFGLRVPDPYRWLEDDNAEDVKEWVGKQNEVAFSYLEKIPYREKIKNRYAELYNYPKYSIPFKEGNKYFYFKNDGLQNQSVLYVQEDLNADPDVFLDPNKFSTDGTISLTTYAASKDGKYFAYGTASGGSDWNEFFIMEIASKKKLGDHLKWIKFSGISWKGDGFYYSRFPEPKEGEELQSKNENGKIYYHKLDTPQSEDILIYEEPENTARYFWAQTTEDERFLLIYIMQGTSNNSLKVKDLYNPDSELITLVDNFENNYGVIDNLEDKLLIQTDKNASNYRLVLVDPKNPSEENWKNILPEKENVLESVSVIGEKIAATYLQDASSHAFLYESDGTLIKEIKLPALGSVSGFSGKRNDNIAFYSFTSFTYPSVIYKFNVSAGESTVFRKPEIKFDFNNYETKQIFYKSKDGTKVPMFIVHKKGIELNGKNPALLYGYGGFNSSETPYFSTSRLILLENGGVYAVANIRGGGEYGEKWHEAGTKMQKQNVFDDFIAAAEYLIKEGYTSPEYLACQGGSNGGLLVGAVINQRPDLFKVAFPAVGVMDMLRFHKFTIGYAWVSDYGSSEESIEMFNYLYSYSPYHNITEQEYPATLVTTADHDDRVVPAHSFKYIACLQEKQKGENPVLIRIETRAGHGAGKPTSKIIEEQADIWSFFFYNIGVEPIY